MNDYKEIKPDINLESTVYNLLAAKARGEHVYCVYRFRKLYSDEETMDSAFLKVYGCTKEEFDKRIMEVNPDINLDSTVYSLLAAKARGERVFCTFQNHKLYSDTVSIDSAYLEVFGYTKEEFERRVNESLEKENIEKEKIKIMEQENAKKVEESRKQGVEKITLSLVISGLKFIAEHQSISQEELVDGLLKLGCNFTYEDIEKQFNTNGIKLFDGMKHGLICSGATVIANMRDYGYSRSLFADRFLSRDDDYSIYHFIRITTGDITYTKEAIDSLNNGHSRI